MSEFWRPSIDPLQELYNHSEQLKAHDESLVNIAQAVNNGAAVIDKLNRHNQHLLNEIHKLRAEIQRLKDAK